MARLAGIHDHETRLRKEIYRRNLLNPAILVGRALRRSSRSRTWTLARVVSECTGPTGSATPAYALGCCMPTVTQTSLLKTSASNAFAEKDRLRHVRWSARCSPPRRALRGDSSRSSPTWTGRQVLSHSSSPTSLSFPHRLHPKRTLAVRARLIPAGVICIHRNRRVDTAI